MIRDVTIKQHPSLKTGTTDYTVQEFKVSVGSWASHCRTVHTSKCADKTPKASPEEQSVMKYLPGLSQHTMSFRSCSGNWSKLLLKSHLGINDFMCCDITVSIIVAVCVRKCLSQHLRDTVFAKKKDTNLITANTVPLRVTLKVEVYNT